MCSSYLTLFQTPSNAFCVDFHTDEGVLASGIDWQLHEGSYKLSEDSDASFGSLDGLERVFDGVKYVAVINTGYSIDIPMGTIVSELCDAISPLVIRRASKVFLALFGGHPSSINDFYKYLTQFEAITGRFEYEYLLQIMPYYRPGQARAVLLVGNG